MSRPVAVYVQDVTAENAGNVDWLRALNHISGNRTVMGSKADSPPERITKQVPFLSDLTN